MKKILIRIVIGCFVFKVLLILAGMMLPFLERQAAIHRAKAGYNGTTR
jgi:hypothetical protein